MSDAPKKNFFSSLEPKSAAIVGVITGFLIICTIGFIVLVVMFASGNAGSEVTAKPDSTLTESGSQNNTKTPPTPTVSTKKEKPKSELFVMSYCPYGLQMQKAYLPVMELLGDKANMSIKWVNYIMHDKKEIDENNVQECIQSEQADKYIAYAKCFTSTGNSESCVKQVGVNKTKLDSCVSALDKKYNITKNYNDKSSWLSNGQYPLYNVHNDLNKKYEVEGSPTLVVNGEQISGVSRTPEAIKKVVCSAFKTKPVECDKSLSSSASSAGFGNAAGTDTAGSGCGS